jgi:hypothetical protein
MAVFPFCVPLNHEFFPLRLSLVGNQVFYHYPAGTRLVIVTIVFRHANQNDTCRSHRVSHGRLGAIRCGGEG